MRDIERELRDLGRRIEADVDTRGGLSDRSRKRIRFRRSASAAASVFVIMLLVATATYSIASMRGDDAIPPADSDSEVFIEFTRSGGFTGETLILMVRRDGSALLESVEVQPPSSIAFVVEDEPMEDLTLAVEHVEWPSLEGDYLLEDVVVADGYRYELVHEGHTIVSEPGAEPQSIGHLIRVLEAITKTYRPDEADHERVDVQVDETNFAALWPEDTATEAEAACTEAASDPAASFRDDPLPLAHAFAVDVLGWEQPGPVIVRKAGDGERTIEVRREEGDQGRRAGGAAVQVYVREVAPDCWSVVSVSRLPDKRPTGVGISVRGRDVEVGFDDLGAESVAFEIGHGFYGLTSEPAGRDGRVTMRLTYPPNDTGHFLLLFKDEDGRVFSASGGPLPAGDFAAG